MPTQGRATIQQIELRRQCNGGPHCLSPSPPCFPLYQINRWGLLPPLRSGRKPFIHGSTGEGQPPACGRGPIGKKTTGVHAGSFFRYRRRLAARRCIATAKRTPPTQQTAVRPTADASKRTAHYRRVHCFRRTILDMP
jgi:hypothetical protein